MKKYPPQANQRPSETRFQGNRATLAGDKKLRTNIYISRFLLALILLLTPKLSYELELEYRVILDRGISPHTFDFGNERFLEISNPLEDTYIRILDTMSNTLNEMDMSLIPGYQSISVTVISLGNNQYEIFANRHDRNQIFDYNRWPYIYRYHISDTGFVEYMPPNLGSDSNDTLYPRFREIGIDSMDVLYDAEVLLGGDYLILHKMGNQGDEYPVNVSRITPEGEVVWTTEIMRAFVRDLGPGRGGEYWLHKGIIPKTDCPEHYLVWGWRRAQPIDSLPYYYLITEIDAMGNIINQIQEEWGIPREWFFGRVTDIASFDDGTYGLVGYIVGPGLETYFRYMHIDCNGNNAGNYVTYGRSDYTINPECAVVNGDKLIVLRGYYVTYLDEWGDPHQTDQLGLIYLNEEGDSLDGYIFDRDTVDTSFPGPIISRDDGKVFVWTASGRAIRGMRDILYTFYPDGRPSAIPDDRQAPLPTLLSLAAYPNPFNARTLVNFSLPKGGLVRMGVYNLEGRLVADLARQRFSAGRHSIELDFSSQVSGVYFLKIESNGLKQTEKLLLLK